MFSNEPSQAIPTALAALESPDSDTREEALSLLNNLPDAYSKAVDKFRPALQSDSEVVRAVAARAIGKFGRGVDWALPDLENGFMQERGGIQTQSAFAYAIGELKTFEAAEVLGRLGETLATTADQAFLAGFVFHALERMGEVAAAQIERLSRVLKNLNDSDLTLIHEVSSALITISKATHAAYSRFKRDEREVASAITLLGKDPIRCTSKTEIGSCKIIYDERVNFIPHENLLELEDLSAREIALWLKANRENLHEVRCVLVEISPNLLGCIAVWDHYASKSLVNLFEAFIEGFTTSFDLGYSGPTKLQEVEFGIFEPFSGKTTAGTFTGVIVSNDEDGLFCKSWLPDEHINSLCGEQAAAIRTYLQATPPAPIGLFEYIEGKTADDLIRHRFTNNLSASPEGRLDYSTLRKPLAADIIETRRSGMPQFVSRNILGDSFDPDGNEEFFGKSLPEPLFKFLLQAKIEGEI